MESPEISVLIPTYNRQKLVVRAIRSVLRQTYGNFRVLVFDNASTDGTEDAIRKIGDSDSRVEYHRHETNIGGLQNGLHALRQVRTPYFLFLSDDDVIFPEVLADARAWFDRFPDAKFVAGGTLETTQGGKLVTYGQSYWPREGYFVPPDGLDLLLAGLHPHWTTMLFRTEVLELVGEPNAAMPNTCDWDFTLRISARHPFVVFRKPSGIFVRHRSSGGEFATSSVIDQFELMKREFGNSSDIAESTRALILDNLDDQLEKRICGVATKQLLRGEAGKAAETLDAFHARRRASAATTMLQWAAKVETLFPSVRYALRLPECVRRFVRAQLSRYAAKGRGIRLLERSEMLRYLNSSP